MIEVREPRTIILKPGLRLQLKNFSRSFLKNADALALSLRDHDLNYLERGSNTQVGLRITGIKEGHYTQPLGQIGSGQADKERRIFQALFKGMERIVLRVHQGNCK